MLLRLALVIAVLVSVLLVAGATFYAAAALVVTLF